MNPTANAFLLAERIPGAELYIIKGGATWLYSRIS